MLRLFSLEKRKVQGDLIAAFHYLKEAYIKAGVWQFTQADSGKARGNGFILEEERLRLDVRKKFLNSSAILNRSASHPYSHPTWAVVE